MWMTIKATLEFEEREPKQVSVTLSVPPANETETDGETRMLLTYMAFNNVISNPEHYKLLEGILVPEINRIIKDMEGKSDSQAGD
jgi:hypothetical protein